MLSIDEILAINSAECFEHYALKLFRFQAKECGPYREYLSLMGINAEDVNSLEQIPFLPIELFKTHKIYCSPSEPEIVFTSSNTGGANPSKHYMAEEIIYKKAFTKCFELFYGDPSKVSIYALLPNYLQRDGSSLIYMVDKLIEQNKQGKGGFYLDDYQALLRDLSKDKGKKILLGVSYALWDLAESHPTILENTIVMETGGMKGQREELSKSEFHGILNQAFGTKAIHSEYGMAELTSQAYSAGDGLFRLPPWMKVVLRDMNNPLSGAEGMRGGINIIDLTNIYSCAFLQTQDLGSLNPDGRFSVLGRADHSEIRGCNLLIAK